ncbi:lipase family protein [Virgisporangium aurantiacum]|uniref:Triacylglycerol lipase n=1 Tax=Virgisporangium aurantiacum TaxID=175570 RepID=A0A8J3ZA08_9ACTN|nr:lipase family protein [Virgisporangium aurantiacum]GIJ59077.1 triacylglycerol lipase [Virgisporangium aurantiacum]
MFRLTHLLLALTVGTATAVATLGVAEPAAAATVPAFYTPPATLPAANGALVRTEPLPLALSLPGITGPLPGRATRIMYRTTDSTGAAVAVTGAYIEPAAPWWGGGARPLVALAPGTLGQGDQCSASLGLQYPIVITPDTVSVGYEILAIYKLLLRGVAVVVTDYVGLGTPNLLHTYVNRVDGGHAVLDAVRAARSLPNTSLTARSAVGLYGYSQGGGATAAAAELQPSYAPDVRLAGTYAGAPPANLADVADAIDGSDLAGALGWSVNGFLQSEPALRPVLDRHLNAAGRAALADLSTMCVGDALFAYGSARSTAWTTSGRSLGDIARSEPVVQAVFTKQRIGTLKPAGPVRLATGITDNLVPHRQARTLAVDWCRLGGDVSYVAVVLPELGRALLNHFAPLLADQDAAIGWLTDRLAGWFTVSNCWTMPLQP